MALKRMDNLLDGWRHDTDRGSVKITPTLFFGLCSWQRQTHSRAETVSVVVDIAWLLQQRQIQVLKWNENESALLLLLASHSHWKVVFQQGQLLFDDEI